MNKFPPLSVVTASAASFLMLACSAQAIISVSLSGHLNTFDTAPPGGTVTGDWVTSTSNIAGDQNTFTTAANIDTFISTYNASTLVTSVGASGTNPPSENALARHNTTLLALQMRPIQTKAANVLLARMQNDTGLDLAGITVSYDFANPGVGVEEIPGWRAYYSLTADPAQSGWFAITEFSGGTAGRRTAFLDFGGAGWAAGAQASILWVDDNAVALGTVNDGTGEASYTLDNFSIVPVPEPSAAMLVLLGGLALTRRCRSQRS